MEIVHSRVEPNDGSNQNRRKFNRKEQWKLLYSLIHALFVWLLCDCTRYAAPRDQHNISRPQFEELWLGSGISSAIYYLVRGVLQSFCTDFLRKCNSQVPIPLDEQKIFSFHTKGTQRIEENRIVLRLFISSCQCYSNPQFDRYKRTLQSESRPMYPSVEFMII